MRWFLRYGPAEASRRPPDATTVALATRAEGFAAACETSNPGRTGNAHGRPLIGIMWVIFVKGLMGFSF